jgi:hypothetical protein
MTEREKFEAWATKTHGKFALSDPDAGSMWSAWQAALASRGCLDDDCPELCSLKDSYGQLLAENVAQKAEIAKLREDMERMEKALDSLKPPPWNKGANHE